MKVAVLRETESEPRVAATPDTVKRLSGLGAEVHVETGAGEAAGLPDADFKEAGATLAARGEVVSGADIVLGVRRPDLDGLDTKPGALLLGLMNPYDGDGALEALAAADVRAVSMDLLPRITRAQTMDVLSSQANLAGYRAVIDAADAFQRALPMMMTAAGTVPAAKVFVMGAGVAGLQAIATARRLGAIVTATDVRAAAGEQVESLGAKFIMHESLKDASGEGGYARELTEDERKAQADLVAGHIAKQDIVITTALIPGRPAPKLVSAAMLAAMKPGSVVADLAAERGGNVEIEGDGDIIKTGGVTVLRYPNMPGRIAATASQLYAKNLLAYLTPLIEDGALKVDREDEIVAATLLTEGGAIVHPRFKPQADAKTDTQSDQADKPAGGAA
ncbi:MAG: Re/Si-specific NAD(P)(+) transhydrogenase subunit alpha [Pseudomonadota bacterium]